MADDCKECGFPIFDEQTSIGLCDVCEKLDPIDRISGRKEKKRLEKARNEELITAAIRNRELTETRRLLEQLLEQNKRSLANVEELRRKLLASDIKPDDVKPDDALEIKSFLREFDNLNVESEI